MKKAALLDTLLEPLRRKGKNVSPTETVGAMGTSVFGGFVTENEKNSALVGREKYRTYSDILANVSMVAAGTRYFLNLVASAGWAFEPSEDDPDGEFAELAEEYMTKDPSTPWARVVRRAAMYRFYGFGVQEWTAKRREDGGLTFADIAPRAQITIERWDIDHTTGKVVGVVQRRPQDSQDIYLPREKIVYMVDDTLSDDPQGLGLFRHLVEPAQRLRRFEQLEGFGFETDLRGIPIGRGPFEELGEKVESGELSQANRTVIEAPIRSFIQNHIRGPKLAMLLDSKTYENTDESSRPSNVRKWDMELLKAPSGSHKEVAASIQRINQEMARILGVENLLIGSDGSGSLALSRDKTQNLFLIVDSTLNEIRETFENDLLDTLWQLNGWPEEKKPTLKTEAVKFKDVEQIAAALRDMATAGAVLAPDDPAINDMRDLLGISQQPDPAEGLDPEDAALTGGTPDEDDLPDPDEGADT